jgi:MerR family copper efflux transcriptional regulator
MRNVSGMSIGKLATRTGCTVPSIRYYEQIGLLPLAERGAGGQRVYGDADFRRLTFIRRCRDFGFPIERVRELTALIGSPDRDCVEAGNIARQHLSDVRRQLKELRALEQSLKQFADDSAAQCEGGKATNCVMLEELARPSSSRGDAKRRARNP